MIIVRQVLINGVTAEVGTDANLSEFQTFQELPG
jgi:hypothetical protein